MGLHQQFRNNKNNEKEVVSLEINLLPTKSQSLLDATSFSSFFCLQLLLCQLFDMF